jgi:Nitroreductase family
MDPYFQTPPNDLQITRLVERFWSACLYEAPYPLSPDTMTAPPVLLTGARASPGEAPGRHRTPSCRHFRARVSDQIILKCLVEALSCEAGGYGYPSAANFYAIRAFVLAPSRICAFDPLNPRARAEAHTSANLTALTFGQVSGPHDLIVLTSTPVPYVNRYGARGLLFMLIEVGAAQALQAALDHAHSSVCWIGGFDDRAVGTALGLTPGRRPCLLIAVGQP